ncbi:hypothetical protein [Actinomadura sp. 7K534]|uniref:hypothetical protein n=1 Tax=Actinomadura sp. 7K534 TaxID=2530366 RepID=UPI00104B0877|nr:hypothetical protein [Actinomadura sp. 7K534]TDB93782.1 hypothetical protein E1266_19040 [Actinomadura sp. 7K534]
MGYPGDQGQPGGWPPRQPPHEPYGPGAEAPPYGRDSDQAPFAPRDDPFAPRDEGPGGMPPGGPDGRFDDDRFGNPYGDSHGHPEAMSSGGPERSGKGRRTPLVIGAAAVAGLVLIGGGIGLSSMLKDDSKPDAEKSPAAATPTPTPSPTQPVLAPVKLKSRTTDPKPLTLKEVFGKGKFKAHGHNYVRTAVNAKKSCASVVGGRALETTLKQGRCTQALRATYALTGGQLIGTVGVFNLETEAAAKKAVKAAAAKDAFLQALPGKGVSKTNGRGEALGTSQARGHYLLMTWVQRPDGKKIPAKHHAAVRVFGAEMVKGSNLALALNYRETEGEPLQR